MSSEERKTKAELIRELKDLRKRAAELEALKRRDAITKDALRESEHRFRQLAENIREVFWIVSADYSEVLYISPAYEDVWGYSCKSLYERPRSWLEAVVEEDRARLFSIVEAAGSWASSRIDFPKYRIVRSDGTVRWILARGYPIRDERGKTYRIAGITEDITERREAEELLVKQHRELQQVLDSVSAQMWYLDLNGRVVNCNRVAEQASGITAEQARGGTIHTLAPTWDDLDRRHQESLNVARTGRPLLGSVELFRAGNDVRWVSVDKVPWRDASGAIIGVLMFIYDITDLKRAEEERRKLEVQIQHARKLESLGVLAGGIAHDFNNLLVAVLGNADLALMDLSPDSPARPSIEQVGVAARRAADLCKQMLAYSGKGRFVVQPVNLNELINETTRLLEVTLSKKVVLKHRLADHLPTIEADATQIRQVLMNLVTNASEAIGEASGAISISTGAMDCNRDYLREAYPADEIPEGTYVWLEIADTGCGMDKTIVEKVFDPFFTTKFTGRGLGMAAVLGIVRGHAGAIKISSQPGRGSTFRILLPAVNQPAESLDTAAGGTTSWQGTGTVLLVDDEETVRTVGRRMIERLGFKVLTASDGQECLDLYRDYWDTIVCVILDLTMPGMSGDETFQQLRLIRPGIRVILSSGYSEQEAIAHFTGKGLAGFIQKPYQSAELIARLRQALER